MPPVIPFRDRPVLEHIVEQHAEEAAFLWTLRDAATDAPHYKRHHLARLDERVEAHVDGLRVAGEAGWRIALGQLERRCEKGELFAAGVLALESGDMRRIEPLVARAEAEPGARRGFVGAIAWCRPAALATIVRAWNSAARPFGRYLALCACSVHRAMPASDFAARLEDGDGLVRARALRLAGELGRVEHLEDCLRRLGDDDADARLWAAWSGVLLGDRTAALHSLLAVVFADGPHRWTALEASVRTMELEAGTRLIRALNSEERSRRAVVAAVGHLGDPAAVPWLIARMDDAELARAAGESFSTITGVDLASESLEREPVEAFPTDPAGRRAEDDREALDADEHLPWPDPLLLSTWWEGNTDRFARGQRYLLGLGVGEEACAQAWSGAYSRQRRSAAYQHCALRPEAGLRNWRRREFLGRHAAGQ